MKILLFTDNLGAGGAQRQLVGLAVMLQQKGIDVKVCTYQTTDFYKPFLDENKVPNEVIPEAANTKKRIWAVRCYFKREKPDWVIAFQETPSLVACVTRILGCRFKLLVSERNTTQVLTAKDKVRFMLYRVADAIVPNSFSQGTFIETNYPNLKSKVKVITNFVFLQKFTAKEKVRRDIPLVIIAATVWAPKNTQNFIKAVSILKERGYKAKFDWYGLVEAKSEANKQYYKQCTELIDRLNVGAYISLLPKTQNIAEKYREADYFCLPSFYEGTPNVICEAMASGCPIICSDVCDNARYVKDGFNGFLFDPKSPEDMANILQKALSVSVHDYQTFCIHSRELAEEMLSEEKFIKSYLEIIK